VIYIFFDRIAQRFSRKSPVWGPGTQPQTAEHS
jgi:hypothetical protein